MAEAGFDVACAHRWFAIELNNLAWETIEAAERTADDIDRMLHAAHASCFHWRQVGAPINALRADCLVATAHMTAGFLEPALHFAQRGLAAIDCVGDAVTAFDRATLHGCLAHVHWRRGDVDSALDHYRQALAAAEAFDHPDETTVFQRLYPPLPISRSN